MAGLRQGKQAGVSSGEKDVPWGCSAGRAGLLRLTGNLTMAGNHHWVLTEQSHVWKIPLVSSVGRSWEGSWRCWGSWVQ